MNIQVRKIPITEKPDFAFSPFEKIFIPTVNITKIPGDLADTTFQLELVVDIDSTIYFAFNDMDENGTVTFKDSKEFLEQHSVGFENFLPAMIGTEALVTDVPFTIDLSQLYIDAGEELVEHQFFVVAENNYEDTSKIFEVRIFPYNVGA